VLISLVDEGLDIGRASSRRPLSDGSDRATEDTRQGLIERRLHHHVGTAGDEDARQLRQPSPGGGGEIRRLERDLPELLSFFRFPRHLWRKLRTTNVIERCFVEVRRRTRPMVCFVNVQSVDRIIYAIFNGLKESVRWQNRTLQLFTHAA
jgi:hypothetical protein